MKGAGTGMVKPSLGGFQSLFKICGMMGFSNQGRVFRNLISDMKA